MIIGIDLGTTNSVAAYLDDEGPRLIPNAIGHVLTPSVVGIDGDGRLLVGRAAKELQVVAPERCAGLFKRHMGSEHTVTLVGQSFTPEKLSSLVLRSLKQDAEAHLGRSIERAVVTVPAYFNDHQRKATIEAGSIAGLDVERIVNEPTAAAMAYGLHESEEDRVLLVFDLGGGTFDVSVVDVFEGALEVRATSGESFLGGEDFTSAMAARLLSDRGVMFERAEFEAPRQVSRLIQQCELAKCRLTEHESAGVRIPMADGSLSDDRAVVEIDRALFGKWTEHILARIELPIRRALGDAGVKRDDIDEVILVGGATRMPSVVERVADIFGRSPRCRINPDEVVALGAAVQAGLIDRHEGLDDLVVTDVAPFTLGVEVSKRIGTEQRDGYFMPIINRNTTIPVSRVDRVSTLYANQTEVIVKVYQGESRRVEDNLALGEFVVSNIPRGPAGQDIDIRFTYDLNGVLEVEATVVKTGQKISHVIARYARGMSPGEIAEAVAQMDRLKTHARDEAVNRFLLRRAERLYQELSLVERDQLADMIDGFEAIMDEGEAGEIEEYREALDGLLDRLESDPQDEAADSDHDQW